MNDAFVPRAVCARCRRPEVVCYCRFVTPVPTRTRVVILQHPRERDVPINTARIASLCLPESELHVGIQWGGSRLLERLLADQERPPVLLYPGPGAIDVEAEPPHGPVTLVVVDGTWWQARKLVRSNPAIAALPRYAFRPPAPSDYRIRKEPQEDYVSTLEALVHVLGVLEGDRPRVEALLPPFRAMVDAQIAYAKSGLGGRRVVLRKANRPPRDANDRLPRALRERPDDLVCVYGEANAWPYGTMERANGADELVQWVAHRVSTGETFSAFVAPRGRLAPSTPRHMELPPETILGGSTTDDLLERWKAFVRPTDVLCCWGAYSLGLFTAVGGVLPEALVDLRRAARIHAVASVGTIEAFLQRLGLPEPAPLAPGRAGGRLAQMVAITQHFSRT